MEIGTIIQIGKMCGLVIGGYGTWWVYMKYNYIKSSVGWKFIEALGKTKKGIGGKDLTLRIKSPAGKELYESVKHQAIIEYEYLERGKKVKKYVIYDERAVDYLNGIPILNVTPLDIRPIDRETGILVNIPSEIIDKLAVDSSKTAEGEAKKDKNLKLLIYGMVAMGILFLLTMTYINQTNTELQGQLAKCSINLAKTAVVITG